MKIRRPSLLILMVLSATSGCATRGARPMARLEPPASTPSLTAVEIVRRLNQNAEPIESLKAAPSVYVSTKDEKHSLNGQLAVQRPRDLKLQLKSTASMSQEADIGSNDQGFWLWVKRQKKVFVGDYEEAGSKSTLGVGFQPEWIIESLGIHVIPEEDARRMTVTQGKNKDAGTYILTLNLGYENGRNLYRQTLVQAATMQVREHRLVAEAQGRVTYLARTQVFSHMKVELPDSESEGAIREVELPKDLMLSWYSPERVDLRITMSRVVPNSTLETALFTEPEFLQRIAHVRIDEQADLADGTMIRETRPAPPVSRIELGEPTPVNVEGAFRSSPTGPLPLESDLPPGNAVGDKLVLPRLPSAPDSAAPRQAEQYTGLGLRNEFRER